MRHETSRQPFHLALSVQYFARCTHTVCVVPTVAVVPTTAADNDWREGVACCSTSDLVIVHQRHVKRTIDITITAGINSPPWVRLP